MVLPRIIVTGASGFVGRHLLEGLKEEYRVVGLARRSQSRSGAPIHPNITWMQVDVAERSQLTEAFRAIAGQGGAEVVIHLAAHYDFTGEDHPEYERTNVGGLRNVLEQSAAIGVRHFIFSSSLAACAFPAPGRALSEESAPDGDHVYARTKRIGEAMLHEYRDRFHSVIVRPAALFSDWCEYPPLFVFLNTWLSSAWNRRILAGRGESAIPYLHIKEVSPFFRRVLDGIDALPQGQVLLLSPDGSVTHRDLFKAACLEFYGRRIEPLFLPRVVCGLGIRVRNLLGGLLRERPFERPWMADYIDLRMHTDARRTRELLGWAPRERLSILRRMPFLVEALKTDPVEWNRRNHEAMKRVHVRSYLRIHQLLERHQDAIMAEFTRRLTGADVSHRLPHYQGLAPEEHEWNHRLILHNLMFAVRTRDRSIFLSYCRDLAARRFSQGYGASEVCDALRMLNTVCFRVLRRDPDSKGLRERMVDHILMTLRAGCDEAQDVFEMLDDTRRRPSRSLLPPATTAGEPAAAEDAPRRVTVG